MKQETSYFAELCRAMEWLAEDPNVIFLGQGVGASGTSMTDTFNNVPIKKRLEFPVAEDFQMGFATGMSLNGLIPVCVYPRWDFLLLAANQLVLHLDRLPLFSDYHPKVIIRVAVPHTKPLHAGPQHDDDFTEAFRLMLRTVDMVTLETPGAIVPAYQSARYSSRSTILVERTGLYGVIPSNVKIETEHV